MRKNKNGFRTKRFVPNNRNNYNHSTYTRKGKVYKPTSYSSNTESGLAIFVVFYGFLWFLWFFCGFFGFIIIKF